jgi:iron complex outermembrane receptor protein
MNLEFLLSNRTELQSYLEGLMLLYSINYLQGTLRSDGSTKLGENNKYDYFPSVVLLIK